VALALAVAAGLMAPSQAAEIPLRVIVFPGLQNLPIYAAQTKGLFARRGLKVDLHFTPNSMVLREGLAKGNYDLAHAAVDNAIAMVELAKVDVVVVMGGDNGLNGLYVQPDIRSIADLRGRTVAVDAPNTAYALQLYKMLAMNGVQRGEYTVKAVGGASSRLEALLKDKSYAASMLNLPHSVRAERGGLRSLGMAVQAIGPYQGSGAFATRSWARANEDTVVRYIQAYLEGLRWVKTPANKAESVALLVERLKLDPEVAGQCSDVVADPAGGYATDARLDVEGFKNVLKLRAEIEGQWGGTPPSPEKYLDLSYYERALAGLR
jgi:ABC-type nitrate/sulfonate/bicarbonate transport system substrate-binding protein